MPLPPLNYKKIFWTTVFFLTILFFGFLIYKIFFAPLVNKPAPSSQDQGEEQASFPSFTPPQGKLPPSSKTSSSSASPSPKTPPQKGVVEKVVKDSVKGIILDTNGGDILFYNKKDGKFYRLRYDGKMFPLSDQSFPQAQSITWAPNTQKAILEFPDGANIVYDFTSQKQRTLPKNWTDFHFSQDSQKIVTKYIDPANPDQNALLLADINKEKAKKIESMGENAYQFQLNWSPRNNVVGFVVKGVDFNHQEIIPVGQYHENFKSFTVNGYGFSGKWSPQGDKILFSIYNPLNDYRPELWITNSGGYQQKNLYIYTWVEKCAFYDNDTVYCGVPQKLKSMAGFSPNYALEINDDIYKINLKTGIAQKLEINDKVGHNIKDLTITKDGQYLYFTGRRTGRLYRVKIRE